VTPFVDAKADRLLSEGRVALVHSAAVVAVQGDHGLYHCTVFASGAVFCSCPAEHSCSHGRAARRLVDREREQVAA
jgi:hypothetical protein